MSFTTTTNYLLTKPDVNSEINTWGAEINSNFDTIDGVLLSLQNQINAVQSIQVVFQ